MSDKVHITGLRGEAIVGLDHWKKPILHPISVDATFSTDFSKATESDNLSFSLNYKVISDKLDGFLRANRQKNFQSLGGLGNAIYSALGHEKKACSDIEVKVVAPKLDIRAVVSFTMSDSNKGVYSIHGLKTLTLIGVFTFERMNKQYVLLDIDLNSAAHLDVLDVSELVQRYLEGANFKTVEALVGRTGQWILQNFTTVDQVYVKVTKLNAIVFTDGVGVSSLHKRGDFDNEPRIEIQARDVVAGFDLPVEQTQANYQGPHTAYVAFGSNVGDPVGNIQQAIQLLNEHPQITVDATSSLYVSKPMYHKDQADFYNGALQLKLDSLSPLDLLKALKTIEYERLSRNKVIENGPRLIDLDILLYDELTVNLPDLIIPHKLMIERTFVLQPLCELIPPDLVHPVTAEPIHDHLVNLLLTPHDPLIQESSKLTVKIPCGGQRSLEFGENSKTEIMAIFNTTPDSFSDGGEKYQLDLAKAVELVRELNRLGATIIDIGGVSTRPGSEEPTEAEELDRVLPIVRAIRSHKDLDHLLISVDTYRSNVAEGVLQAGADIINDISMGLFDPAIFGVVSRHLCGYVMNHTRGTPATMATLTDYSAAPASLVEYYTDSELGMLPSLQSETSRNLIGGVCRELAGQMQKAVEAGVRKWQIIVDPGVGFAKNLHQNLEIIRHAARFSQYSQLSLSRAKYWSFLGLPVLVGTSRKKFLGTLTGKERAADRVIGLVATVVAMAQQGVNIVRVHDVKETKEALDVADALYGSEGADSDST